MDNDVEEDEFLKSYIDFVKNWVFDDYSVYHSVWINASENTGRLISFKVVNNEFIFVDGK